jgi:hypothetical protein
LGINKKSRYLPGSGLKLYFHYKKIIIIMTKLQILLDIDKNDLEHYLLLSGRIGGDSWQVVTFKDFLRDISTQELKEIISDFLQPTKPQVAPPPTFDKYKHQQRPAALSWQEVEYKNNNI